MCSMYDYIVKPLGERYSNSKKIEGKELIINAEVFNHQHVNREAVVLSIPKTGALPGINIGDTIIVHHNVFRRWHDVKGRERNSRSFLKEEQYLVSKDQVFLYKRDDDWACPDGYCFVQPIKDNDEFESESERALIGIVKYSDGELKAGELVGFRPKSEFEFIVDGQRMYRVLSNFITIKYEYQGDEEEYNPSWA